MWPHSTSNDHIRIEVASSVALAALFSLFECIPVLSAVVSFVSFLAQGVSGNANIDEQITYSLTGHNLNIATIFSALQLFNVSETLNLRL